MVRQSKSRLEIFRLTDPGYLEIDGQQILANTGLSATLIKNIDEASPDFGTYTLSIRSSEYLSTSDGGDFDRDIRGADGGIAQVGFALAQLDSLERYVEWLQRQNFLEPNQKIYVTGYSLGAHLATLFTELHPEKVIHAYTFNGAGRGEWNHEKGEVGDILNFFRSFLSIRILQIIWQRLPNGRRFSLLPGPVAQLALSRFTIVRDTGGPCLRQACNSVLLATVYLFPLSIRIEQI